jgi:outer membrane protein assembly factor BamB
MIRISALIIVLFLSVSCSGETGKSSPFIETPGTNGTILAYDGNTLLIRYHDTNYLTNIGLKDPMLYSSNILIGVYNGKLWRIELAVSGPVWSQFGDGTSLFTDSGLVYTIDGSRLRYYKGFIPQNSFELPGGLSDVQMWGGKFLIGKKDGRLTVFESAGETGMLFRQTAEIPEAVMWIVHPSSPYVFYSDRNDRLFVYNLFSKTSEFIDAPPFEITRMEILRDESSLMVYSAGRVFIYAECANRNITGLSISPLDISADGSGKFYYFLYPGKIEIWTKVGGMKEGEIKF